MLSTISTPSAWMVFVNPSMRFALNGKSGLPPLNAATILIFHSGWAWKVFTNCGTCDVSVPMIPARSSRVAQLGDCAGA